MCQSARGRAFQGLQLVTGKARGECFTQGFLLHTHTESKLFLLPGGRSQAASSSSLPRPAAELAAETSSRQRTRRARVTKRPPTRVRVDPRPIQHLHTQPYQTQQQGKACLLTDLVRRNCQKLLGHDSKWVDSGQFRTTVLVSTVNLLSIDI